MSISVEEKNSMLALIHYFNDKWIIVDVGSNKGEWSDIFINERDSSIHDGKYEIHLIEPNELLLNYTKVKYDYNKHIKYYDKACYEWDDKEIDFYYFINENSGLSSIYHNPKWDYLPMLQGYVTTITLDTYAKDLPEIDIIKIDVEGAETDVLKGCTERIKNKNVKFIQVEYSEHYILSGVGFKNVISFFNQFGYNCYSWDGEHFQKVLMDDFVEDYRLENFVFTYLTIGQYEYTQLWNNEFKKTMEGFGKFDFVLEIGCFEGLTSNYICDNLLNGGGRLVCVDPFEDTYLTENITEEYGKLNNSAPYFKDQYKRFIHNTKEQPIEVIRRRSDDAFENEIKEYTFDLCYVDGDHRKEAVMKDAINCLYHTRIGGLILFDDYDGWKEETKKAVDEFLEKYMDFTTVLKKGYQVLVRKTKNL